MTVMRSSLVVAIITMSCAAAGAPTLLLALMVRDEEANLRANLPAFSGLADFVVCGIDDRSRDGSARAVAEALPDVPRWVFYFRFDGFGRGRTGVFREAWRKFPEASHVLVLDPDWELDAPRASRAHLNADERTFLFKVWDRNGMTSRTMNWLVKHEANLTFEHQLHEQLVQPNAGPGPQRAHVLPWEFAEREVRGRDTWHSAATAHGHSQSYERYLFDLELLDMDLADLGPDDPHTLFYLGVTHLSALDAMLGIGEHERTPKTDYHVAEGVKYLTARVDEALLARERATFAGAHEHTWGALRWLAHAHHFSTRDFARARTFYGRCAAYDPGRRDCAVFLAKLCRDEGRHGEAFALAFEALAAEAAPAAPRDALKMVDNFYVPRCTLPLEASLALLPALETAARDGGWRALRLFGVSLLERAARDCDDPERRFVTEQPAFVDAARDRYAALGPPGACAPRGDALAAAGGNATALATMVAAGLWQCPSPAVPPGPRRDASRQCLSGWASGPSTRMRRWSTRRRRASSSRWATRWCCASPWSATSSCAASTRAAPAPTTARARRAPSSGTGPCCCAAPRSASPLRRASSSSARAAAPRASPRRSPARGRR